MLLLMTHIIRCDLCPSERPLALQMALPIINIVFKTYGECFTGDDDADCIKATITAAIYSTT